MASVRQVRGYPSNFWFFDDWKIFTWCKKNNINVIHECSGGPHGNALSIHPNDSVGLALFLLTWT